MLPSPDMRTIAAPELATIARHAPGAFYMTGEDSLQISGWNITASARLRVSGRFLGLDGQPRAFEHDVALTTDRAIASLVRQLGEGWLLNLQLNVSGATSPYGATFARAQVVRGVSTSGIVLGTLCAGYVTSAQPIAFPGGRVRSMADGRGNIRSIAGTDPAAGVELSETVPTGVRWQVLMLTARLVSSAAVASRQPTLLIDDGTSVLWSTDPPDVQPASENWRWNAGQGTARLSSTYDNKTWNAPVQLVLLPGFRLRSVTGGFQAGDNWGAMQLLVEEWLEAP